MGTESSEHLQTFALLQAEQRHPQTYSDFTSWTTTPADLLWLYKLNNDTRRLTLTLQAEQRHPQTRHTHTHTHTHTHFADQHNATSGMSQPLCHAVNTVVMKYEKRTR